MTNNSAVSDLAAGLDLALTALSLGPYIQGAFGNRDPNMTGAIQFETGFFHGIIGTIRVALAAAKQLGFWGQAAANAAVVTVKAAIAGWPMILQTLITLAAGNIGNAILDAGGHYLVSLGMMTEADYTFQMGESIGAWCRDHSGTCTKPPTPPNTD